MNVHTAGYYAVRSGTVQCWPGSEVAALSNTASTQAACTANHHLSTSSAAAFRLSGMRSASPLASWTVSGENSWSVMLQITRPWALAGNVYGNPPACTAVLMACKRAAALNQPESEDSSSDESLLNELELNVKTKRRPRSPTGLGWKAGRKWHLVHQLRAHSIDNNPLDTRTVVWRAEVEPDVPGARTSERGRAMAVG